MTRKVAVIGLSFRFPSTDPGKYWADLLEGKDLVTQVEASRWARDALLHPAKDHPGTSYTLAAGSIGDVSGFDAGFFGISPREATLMDPQQRVLLELCWEAIENAGVKPSALRGSDCGVYVGISSTDYSYRMADDLDALGSYSTTGSTSSIAANRLSYVFDLHGPSMSIDTACSSSLVAFHQACRAIAGGEIGMAIAGGISLHLHPFGFIGFSKASMLSPNGRCRSFDASGDGYVRSEGGGLLLLKDYDQAVADGDTVLAVVAGTAVNTDGRKSGLTVPNADAQIALLRQAYEQAGIAPSEIDYLEAHGTGTPVGDPIEARAIGLALGQARAAGAPLPIGSIKSNLGHLEAASGVAGLVKAIYSLRHRVVPSTIGIRNPNPNIPFDDWNIHLVTQPLPLRASGTLTIGINSFGFGGANAHAILQTPPNAADRGEPHDGTLSSIVPLPVVVSGRDAQALRQAARDMADALRAEPSRSVYDVAYHAAMRRDWHAERAVVFGTDPVKLAEALERFSLGETDEQVHAAGGVVGAKGPVFIYSGNGAQWAGMGRKLMAVPVFAKAVDEIDALFVPLAGWRLADILVQDAADLYERTEVAQPALFAMQVGVTRMLAECGGVQPQAVAGHSVGEIAAAWACGALDLEDAVKVIYHRSHLQGTTKGQGRMAAVGLDGDAAAALIAELGLQGVLHVAGCNSTRGATLAGPASALDRLGEELAARHAAYRRLDLDYAFHSPAMDGLQTPLLRSLADLQPRAARIPFHSTVAGTPVDGTLLDAAYWWRNIREPVRFEQIVHGLVEQGMNVYVEIGPHPILRSYLNDGLKHAGQAGLVVATGSRGGDDPAHVRAAASQVLLSGAQIDWPGIFPGPGERVELPAYPWQRERYWHPLTPNSAGVLERRKVHPLLGYPLRQQHAAWENQLDTQTLPWLADHGVGEAVLFPGAGFAEIALAAARQWQSGEHADLEDLELLAPLPLHASPSRQIRLTLDDADGRFMLRAREVGDDAPWTLHASGRLLSGTRGLLLAESMPAMPNRPHDFSSADHALLTRSANLNYGPAFQAIARGWIESPDTVVAELEPDAALADSLASHLLHPVLLDSAFQLIFQLLERDAATNRGMAFIPARIGRLCWRAGLGQPSRARARLVKRAPYSITAEFDLFDAHGRQIATARDVRLRGVRLARDAARLDFLDYAAMPCPHPLAPAFPVPPALRAEAVQDALTALARSVQTQGLLDRYVGEVDPLLESLCDHYAAQTLRGFADDGRIDAGRLYALRESSPQAAALLDSLVALAKQNGDLQIDPDGWRLADTQPGQPEAADIWNSLLREYPDYFAIVHAAGRIGLRLPELLQGRPFPDICPRDATPAALARCILGKDATRHIGAALRERLAQALRERGAGQRIAVLETSGLEPTFAPVLCTVLDFTVCDYAYASPSSAALQRAERLRERHPGLVLHAIDDASEPAQEAGQADLILFHCDFDTLAGAHQALHYARARLKPGGTLLLCGTHPAAWMDFIFGAQAAWWSDHIDGARSACQYSAEYWQSLARQLGLQTQTLLEFAPGSLSGPYLLAAGAPACAPAATDLPAASGGWLLLTDAQPGVGRAMAEELAHELSGAARARVMLRAATSAELDFDELLAHARTELGSVQGIVHLAGLAQSDGDDDPEALLQTQVLRCAIAAGLARGCERAGLQTTLWLVTTGAATFLPIPAAGHAAINDAALWNYGRTLSNEAAAFGVRLLDLPASGPLQLPGLLRELLAPDGEQEVALRGAQERYAPRLRFADRPETPADGDAPHVVRLGFDFPGQLRNLRWTSQPLPPLADDELEIRVLATGLNFRDVMYTLGLLSDEAVENGYAGPTLGLEFAGEVERAGRAVGGYRPGDRVVGFGPAGFSDRVRVKTDALAHIPPGMDAPAAATIPSVFFTVYYALHHLARLEPGEAVLIHGAAGGVGIAAVQYAQWRGAEIHATAGSDEKRDFLRQMGVAHIYDSRSLTYADEILAATGGRGVDVVLNSLAGEAINRNLQALKPFGRFLELGKRDFYENTRIGLRPFRNNISYFGIDADQLMRERPDLTRRLFAEMMDLFRAGELHPLPYHAFDADEVVDAFRHMQQARQIGKIVVTYGNGIAAPRRDRRADIALRLSADASYLVTGGLSGLGLRTARWLADKGARHLVLIGRSGPATQEAQQAVEALRERGVAVLAQACDVTDKAALADLLKHIEAGMPALKGIVHAAMVIDDGLIQNTDPEQIRRVLAPKVLGALHLDELTRDDALDFFVVYSSGTTLFGNPGQANYVAANGWLEALAAQRRARGLPATCARWGAIGDAGYLARNQKTKDALQSRMGGSALPFAAALDALEDMLLADAADLGVMAFDWRALSRFLPSAAAAKFSWMARDFASNDQEDAGGADIADLLASMDAADLHPVVVGMLKHEVGEILRLPIDKIDPGQSVYDMGLDSLMGVELVVALENRFGVRLPVMALNDNATLDKLASRLIELLRHEGAAPADEIAGQVAKVAAQHAQDVSSEIVDALVADMQTSPDASKRMIT
jgi:acyl transferase domain-containing protein/NADPH:quinone reductase-like Zn-dependent oxidoreductase/acyl carrier protein